MPSAVNASFPFGLEVDLHWVLADNSIVRVQWIGDIERLGTLADDVRNGRFEDLDRYLETQGQMFRGSGANLVARVELEDGGPVVAKRFGWRKRWHSWFSPFKRSKAFRAYDAAERLIELGLRTPKPLLSVEGRTGGFVRVNYLFTESLGETRSSRVLLRESDDPEKIVREIARIVRRMHDGGLCHRDLTLANFHRRGEEDSLYVIDLNRARIRSRIGAIERFEDIARIDLSPEHLEVFLEVYLDDPNVSRYARSISFRKRIRTFRRSLKRR
jgi:tRNA A-37 threonylcarbamoyl transferase component Bud32